MKAEATFDIDKYMENRIVVTLHVINENRLVWRLEIARFFIALGCRIGRFGFITIEEETT